MGAHEVRTAEIASRCLEYLGFNVTKSTGRYGTVGVFSSGLGSAVLRVDMDALSIFEMTKLPYTSPKTFTNETGKGKPTIHTHSHNMDITNLIATAMLLVEAESEWSGVLICLFQPNEENGASSYI